MTWTHKNCSLQAGATAYLSSQRTNAGAARCIVQANKEQFEGDLEKQGRGHASNYCTRT